MVTKLNICNLALAQLGQSPLTALNEDTERARRLNLFYEPVRDELLRTHNWRFASAENALIRVDIPAPAPDFVYKYPAQALFVRRVFHANAVQQSLPFSEFFDESTQQRVLRVPAAAARAQYTRRITDESIFDPGFVKAFSLALACDLAVTLTADSQLAGQLWTKYQLALEEARRSNMMENFQQISSHDAFTEVR